MRISVVSKLFFYCALSALLMFLYISLRELKKNTKTMLLTTKTTKELLNIVKTDKITDFEDIFDVEKTEENESGELKYILQWTSSKNVPFVYMGVGRQGFIDRKCPYTNCFVTSDRNYLGDVSKFDVVAFAGPELAWSPRRNLPDRRSPHQKYVFASIESADNYPMCSDSWNGFFNWTWTYRLDSESKWGYIVIRDSEGHVIGPKKEMHWIKLEDMDPVTDEFKSSLKTKSKAAAWFVSNCGSRSHREVFVRDLQKELNKFQLTVDIYGTCGNFKCSRDDEEKCDKIIEKDYYFYLSFENSFDEDYVTEKLLHGLNYNAIPIVYGGANYTRFMPEGIYLNSRELGAKKLAEKMNDLIQNIDEYSEYFRWKKYYKYFRRDAVVETNDYCAFCTILNNKAKVKETSIYENFRKWWDPPNRC